MKVRLATSNTVVSRTSNAARSFWPTGRFSRRWRNDMRRITHCGEVFRVARSLAVEQTLLGTQPFIDQMLDQPQFQLLQMWDCALMAFSRSTGVTQQVTDFSSAPLSDILIHRRVVGGRRLNHPQH